MAKIPSREAKPELGGIELHPDAWDRFRQAVRVMAKAGPQHRESKEGKQKLHPGKTKKTES